MLNKSRNLRMEEGRLACVYRLSLVSVVRDGQASIGDSGPAAGKSDGLAPSKLAHASGARPSCLCRCACMIRRQVLTQ